MSASEIRPEPISGAGPSGINPLGNVPERYLPLIAAVEKLQGVRKPLEEVLALYFQPSRDQGAVIEGLQPVLLRNWGYFEQSPQRAELFSLFAELLVRLLEEPLSDTQLSLLIRLLLTWSLGVLRGRYAAAYPENLLPVAKALDRLMAARPAAFLERDTLIRDLAGRALQLAEVSEEPADTGESAGEPAAEEQAVAGAHTAAGEPAGETAAGEARARAKLAPSPPASAALATMLADLYRGLLARGYSLIAGHLDLLSWSSSSESDVGDPEAIRKSFASLAGKRMEALMASLAAASPQELLSDRYPPASRLIDEALRSLCRLENLDDRLRICMFLLKDDALGYRQREVMTDLLATVRSVLAPPGSGSRSLDLLSRLTPFFRRRPDLFPELRLQTYEALGIALGEWGEGPAADRLIDDLLSWPFQYPDVLGATEEWQTIVNPFHLPNIRAWLSIIESNPSLFDRLAAALDVELRLGGVFIADTELFQKDITRLLNADISPVYFLVKQLLRRFPVYFNEVGAEGELRAVSTEVDDICERKDQVMHFLRKQSHAESSNRLVDFGRAVLSYWATLDPEPLRPFLPSEIMAEVERGATWAEGPNRVLSILGGESPVGPPAGDGASPRAGATRGRRAGAAARRVVSVPSAAEAAVAQLLRQTPREIQERVQSVADGRNGVGATDRRRVILMVRLQQLLEEKYSLSAADLDTLVGQRLQIRLGTRRAFAEALREWRRCAGARPSDVESGPSCLLPSVEEVDGGVRERLLDASLSVLEELKEIILSPKSFEGVENIYHKRHIAAGIASMYGSYTEPKFDALGLSFRVEALVSRLLEETLVEAERECLSHASLSAAAKTLRRFQRALAVDGIQSHSLLSNLELLEASLGKPGVSFQQYQNIFQFLAQSVSDLVRTSLQAYDPILRLILQADERAAGYHDLHADAVAEVILRDVLVATTGLQTLDRYLGTSLRRISALRERVCQEGIDRMMDFEPERLISWIHEPSPHADDQISLGYKALGLKQLAQYGYRVPEGFILTTELYAARPAITYRPFYREVKTRIWEGIRRLEAITGLRIGDRQRLLTLSIRSGAAVSMPGLMMTFTNVGLNEELAEAMAGREGLAWSAWDSYRRFLQSWAMSEGVERDFFDAIMAEFKTLHGVEQKLDFAPGQMRDIALAYKSRARARGVRFIDDPVRQIEVCIRRVLTSWDAPQARLYRGYLGLGEEWGTAVIIQRMVLGNRGRSSGSGVTFTRDPYHPDHPRVRLFGDFTPGSQGEDLVAGLVFPLPISEAQRAEMPVSRGRSLEHDFPGIYHALEETAEDLVINRAHDPQEIEFTFESPDPADLFLLQKRPMVQERGGEEPVFVMEGEAESRQPLAVGLGVAGGAYTGRVAISVEQIDELVATAPDENIVLLRPDTVPEDIGMIVRVEGILTARGGATSHAAVTAKRLGKTAVVDCRDLQVLEFEGAALLGGHRLERGDWLSIDGRTGYIFLGKLKVTLPYSP